MATRMLHLTALTHPGIVSLSYSQWHIRGLSLCHTISGTSGVVPLSGDALFTSPHATLSYDIENLFTDARYMYCSGNENPQNTMSHVNPGRMDWFNRTFTWKAPVSVSSGNIRFWATIVHDFSTFWSNIKSDLIRGPAITLRPSVPVEPDFTITKAGCNTTKSCVSIPSNCSDSKDCEYLLVYSISGSNITIEMSARNKYVSVGFNTVPAMNKGDDVFCTLMGDGALQARLYWNNGHSAERQDNTVDLTLLRAAYSNGTIKCSVLRPLYPKASNLQNLTSDLFLIFAHGMSGSTGTVHYHYANRWSTAGKVNLATPAIHTPYYSIPTAPAQGDKVNTAGCGETKGCYAEPQGCKDHTDCKYLVTYKTNGAGNIEFELTAKNDWVAIGFSYKNKGMDGIDTMVCATVAGKVELHHYALKGYSLPEKTTLNAGDTSLVFGVREGDSTRCKFLRKISPGTANLRALDRKWHLVFGDGPVSGSVQKHTKTPIFSKSKIDLRVSAIIRETEGISALVKAHGCVMSIAWLAFATVAIFMARYMKSAWKGEKIFGKLIWFQVHRAFMMVVVLLSCVGLILIFLHVEGWSDVCGAILCIVLCYCDRLGVKCELMYCVMLLRSLRCGALGRVQRSWGAHPYMGITAVGLAVIQPFMALLRPGPAAEKRFIFNWAHRFVGISALTLAVATLFLATLNYHFIRNLGLKNGFWVLIAYCIGIIFVLIFEIMQRASPSKSKGFTLEKSTGMVEQMGMQQPQLSLTSDGRKHRLVLGFVILFSFGTGLAMITLIALI
ncbi:predicted protein [Nematostella vectensis]|uniref:Ferric-chelate reductase 1 n=1 Tax=Nematostella vectensis TaxID=45351 RepID=A7SP75_NEMVE|nr:predicted protein [Nematostella vectensis]|eukprot:XP_001626592.1 predicted protein [Nematostella vectensis]